MKIVFDIEQFLENQKFWSEIVFGTGRRTIGICNHIRSELIEIEDDPDNLEEWIDVLLLAFDATWRLGASPKDVVETLLKKQHRNINREWGPIPPETEPSFHLREKETMVCSCKEPRITYKAVPPMCLWCGKVK
jgi:hypothetical protein